jgi:hypothetical protein
MVPILLRLNLFTSELITIVDDPQLAVVAREHRAYVQIGKTDLWVSNLLQKGFIVFEIKLHLHKKIPFQSRDQEGSS